MAGVGVGRFDAAAALAELPPLVDVGSGFGGLDGPVVIERDPLGIPHVIASSVEDLFFGQGFATAQDRLWHLEWDRRRALGRSAELIGSPTNVVNDGFNRRARLGDFARSGYARLDPDTRAVLDAHAAGVNAFMASTPARPVEFQALDCPDETWAGWHAVAIFLVRHVTFATWQTKLWNARVLAALGADAVARFRIEGASGDTPLIVPPGARAAVGALVDAGLFSAPGAHGGLSALEPLGLQLSGSNAWAVHGSRTASGLPLIAGDPHRPFEVPNVYYQIRLSGPGIEAAGFSFPGIPGVPHFAQTPNVAWAVTNAMADYQDLFIERLPNAATDTRTEVIRVRGSKDVEVECVLTNHGPVVLGSHRHEVGVALASTGLTAAGGSLRTILPMLRATSVAGLDASLAGWVEPANNFVLADSSGHIAYRTAGLLPTRHALNTVLPVPGWDTTYDWTGSIPDAALPRAFDPVTGAIVTANQRVTDRDFPYLLNDDASPRNRADRIWHRLGDRVGLTVDDQASIHTDAISIPALALAQRVLVAGAADEVLAGLLRDWDGGMAVDSAAAAVVGQVRHELCRLVTAMLPERVTANPFAEWEPPATAVPAIVRVANVLSHWLADDDTTLIGGSSWNPLIAEATRGAVAHLTELQGPDPTTWTWGRSHQATPLHPARGLSNALDALVRPVSGPLAGASDCVMAMNQMGGVTTDALTGSTARYVWDLADPRNSRWVTPLGASGHPGSPNFRDQTPAWGIGQLHPVVADTVVTRVELRTGRG
jgi:penicillin G amidase